MKPNLGRWTVSSDGLTYRWEIDPRASWSDGKPIVAEDYLTAVKIAAMSKLTVRKSYFQDIAGWREFADGRAPTISGVKIDDTDPKKFSVTFARVFCPALTLAFGPSAGPMPTHVFGKYVAAGQADAIDRAPENTAPPVASGPFVFKLWRKGDVVILTRNPSYFKGAPLIDEHVFKVVGDATVAAAQLKTGELNYYAIEAKDLADIEAHPDLKVFKFQQLSYTYIGWNVKSQTAPALQDKRVRQALAYGIDMDAIVKIILFGQGTQMIANHPPASWAAPSSGLTKYGYDRAKAEDLLRSAGYARGADGVYAKGGRPIEFSMVTNSGNKAREALLQVAVEQYKSIGVKVNPKLEAFETMVEKLTMGSQEIQAWIIGWSLGLDPDGSAYGFWHSSQIPDPVTRRPGFNVGSFTTPELDRAIEGGRTGSCSQVERKKHYETFNRILNDEQPYNFGFSPYALLAVPKSLRGIDPGTFNATWNIEKWWFKY